jgi:hypothetical protein
MVARTAVGSYPQWAMQLAHSALPLVRPYYVQSEVSTRSLYVGTYPSACR